MRYNSGMKKTKTKTKDKYVRTSSPETAAEAERQSSVKALREAAMALDDMQTPDNDEFLRAQRDPALWLHDRADQIEGETA